MEFTYDAYEQLLALCKDNGFCFCSYSDYEMSDKCAILRHDVDMSPQAALKIAELEEKMNVRSTFFVLLNSGLYNPAAKIQKDSLRAIHDMGHRIGLHFDEAAYEETADIPAQILREAGILSDILEMKICEVSMHRPSIKTLESDYHIPGIINSYSSTFFKKFKYISDSRRCWREDPIEVICAGKYDRLHILTHPFWYEKIDGCIENSLKRFIDSAASERYEHLADNIRGMEEIILREKVK